MNTFATKPSPSTHRDIEDKNLALGCLRIASIGRAGLDPVELVGVASDLLGFVLGHPTSPPSTEAREIPGAEVAAAGGLPIGAERELDDAEVREIVSSLYDDIPLCLDVALDGCTCLTCQVNRLLESQDTDLSFGEAITLLEHGHRVGRAGWNGKGMWVYYMPAGTITLPDDSEHDCLPFLIMKTADGSVVPWLASQTDVLADDWARVLV